MSDLDSLLQPTLRDTRASGRPYSLQAFFLASFFGGPVAAAFYTGCNAHALGRLRRDLPWIAAMLGSFAALVALLAGSEAVRAAMDAAGNIGWRLVGLACCGAGYWLHRPQYRSAQVAGVDLQSGLKPGLAAFLLGLASLLAIARLLPAS